MSRSSSAKARPSPVSSATVTSSGVRSTTTATSAASSGIATPPSPGTYGRVSAWLAKHVEVTLASIDLTLPQYRVLGLLQEGSAVASALADRLAVRPPSISSVVEGLCVRGLIVRGSIEDDRRRVPLALTPEGATLLATADRAIDERLMAIARSLPDQASSEALQGLELWGAALASHHRQKHGAQ